VAGGGGREGGNERKSKTIGRAASCGCPKGGKENIRKAVGVVGKGNSWWPTQRSNGYRAAGDRKPGPPPTRKKLVIGGGGLRKAGYNRL